MRFTLSFLLLLLFFSSNAQEEIFLKNPSFEDFPKLSHTPASWFDCGFPGESQVDIHPVPGSEFQVDHVAIDGETYLGMVTRENETWEAIGQRLSQPLIGGKTYSFSIHLAKSATYLSAISNGNPSNIYNKPKKINFATPIKLRIWGGNGYCKKVELLGESSLVINTQWLDYNFILQPKDDLPYITFEVFYQAPCPFPYNGNILLDNASSFLEVENFEYLTGDSLSITLLDSMQKTQTLITTQINTDQVSTLRKAHAVKLNKKYSPKPTAKPQQNNLIEGVLTDENRIFLNEQLEMVKFEKKSPYLEDRSIDAIIEIVKKLNSIDDELKIDFSINAVETNWDKKRGKEILTLLTEAGIDRYRITLRKYPPTTKSAYFRGGYGDVYMCIH